MSRFLLKQHATPSATTGKSLAEMMFNRKIKTILDTLKPKPTEDNLEEEMDKGVTPV